jgi:hypothetical protein
MGKYRTSGFTVVPAMPSLSNNTPSNNKAQNITGKTDFTMSRQIKKNAEPMKQQKVPHWIELNTILRTSLSNATRAMIRPQHQIHVWSQPTQCSFSWKPKNTWKPCSEVVMIPTVYTMSDLPHSEKGSYAETPKILRDTIFPYPFHCTTKSATIMIFI